MRGLFLPLCLALPLAGCLTDRDLHETRYQASETAQATGQVTPQIAAECLEKASAQFPKVKIVGPFSLAPSLARRVPAKLTLLPSHEHDDLVILAAPSISNGIFGEIKSVAGCSYHFRDNRLVFNDVHVFGARTDVLRVKPAGT
jgi:hypothetical protein